MRLAAALLALLPSCSLLGSAVEGTGTATGAAAGAFVGGPAGAAVGAVLGAWGGDAAAEALTDTRSLRVPVGSGKGLPDLPDLPGHTGLLLGGSQDTMLYLLAIIAFIALGGPAWALKKINDSKAADESWTKENAADRSAHKDRTARLEAKVELLEKLLIQTTPGG